MTKRHSWQHISSKHPALSRPRVTLSVVGLKRFHDAVWDTAVQCERDDVRSSYSLPDALKGVFNGTL